MNSLLFRSITNGYVLKNGGSGFQSVFCPKCKPKFVQGQTEKIVNYLTKKAESISFVATGLYQSPTMNNIRLPKY